tara:strand:- start:204 stop:377 length:174 start_codon:yes stop_codon:yes gene_type:complete
LQQVRKDATTWLKKVVQKLLGFNENRSKTTKNFHRFWIEDNSKQYNEEQVMTQLINE